MKTFLNKSFSDVIGNTPLIKLRSASKITKCNIYGKCEFLNPGGSVKDRAALQIITDALKSGAIKKGGTVYRRNCWKYRYRTFTSWKLIRIKNYYCNV